MKHILAAALAGLALSGCTAVTAEPLAVIQVAEAASPGAGRSGLNQRIAYFARIYNVPEALVHRIVRRESNYNPGARNGPYWGLMQIRYDTAQGIGYRGPAQRLLDADTNMTYAVAYLANAYKVAGGNHDRAVQLYARGYYFEAKRKGMLNQMIRAAN